MNFRDAREWNEKKKCSVPNCFNNRDGISKYCKKHKLKATYHGHPEANPFKKKDYLIETQQIKHLVELNLEHEGIQYGIRFFDKMLEVAGKGFEGIPQSLFIARLYDAGVTGKELLIETASLYLLYEEGRIIKSDSHLIRALGNKILRFKKHGFSLSGPQFEAIGKYIIRHVGVLVLNLAKSAIIKDNERNTNLLNMQKPLTLS